MRRVDNPVLARRVSFSAMPEDEFSEEIDLSSLPRRGRRNAVVHFELSALDGSAIAAHSDLPSPTPAAATTVAATSVSEGMPAPVSSAGSAQEDEEDVRVVRRRRNALVAFQLGPSGALAFAEMQLEEKQ